MNLVFYPGLFSLGVAVGVLGLVLLFSLIISYAYDERTLLTLAGYLVLMALVPLLLARAGVGERLIQESVLVLGPTATALGLMWLLRDRKITANAKLAIGAMLAAGVAMVVVSSLPIPQSLAPLLSYGWFAIVLAFSVFVMVQQHATAGPWVWWYLLGNLASLGVAIAFLSGNVEAEQSYWPQVLMHLLQLPPIYLALVWRSRLLNESRLRSASAGITDPLTGLATSAVLLERLMRVASRANKTSTVSALFLIDVQNWQGLVAELGDEFNEKLLLEAALRLRRAIGDNDLAARLSGGRFAVVAQGLAGAVEVTSLATRLMVSGLRIDSPVLTGIEFKFRIVVCGVRAELAPNLTSTKTWVTELTALFSAWPVSHRSRNILLVAPERFRTGSAVDIDVAGDIESDITSDPPVRL